MTQIHINGVTYDVKEGATILDTINQHDIPHPQICHVPTVDPIETCDTCIVEVNGQLVRSCSTKAVDGMNVLLTSDKAKTAQTEAMDRLLENHLLYCTVCDNNNGNCTLHNTAELMEIEHQKYPYKPKVEPHEVDMSHPFYRYDPNQCIASDNLLRLKTKGNYNTSFPKMMKRLSCYHCNSQIDVKLPQNRVIVRT